MGKIINHNKICDKCNGEPVKFGYRTGIFGYKVPFIYSECDNCVLGVIKEEKIVKLNEPDY